MTPERWRAIREVLDEALELAPPERPAYLDRACATDASLRQEVESLLASSEEARSSFLESSPLAHVALTEAAETQDPMIGRHLGVYQLVKRIGQGGMGAVFLAVRADGEFRQQVAIKFIRPGMDSEELLRRFRNERQTLAGLDHPNIVKLLDGGSTPEGLPYLVMDYVEGSPIDKFCDKDRLSIQERLKLFTKVCEAVEYAHEKRVIHRDLKPSNILVTAEGVPKLLDFGIAKVLELAAPTPPTTGTGTRCMTPAYASPEQVRGRSVTPATDIYSLGVVLYELLTGHPPYRLKEHTPSEIERAICEQEPENPSLAVSRVETETHSDGTAFTKTPELVSQTREGQSEKLRRRLRGDLDNIVLKALRKEPEARYRSTQEFAQDIERHLDHLPITARPSGLGYRASKFVQRHKVEAGAGLIGALALAAAAFFAFDTRGHPDRPLGGAPARIQSIAVLPLANLSGDPAQEYFSDGMTDALITALSQISSVKVISRTSTARYKKANESVPQIASDLNVDGIIDGTVQRSGDRVRITVQLIQGPSDKELWAGTYERDLRNLFELGQEVTEEIARQIQVRVTTQNRAQTRSVNLRALEAYLQGNHHLNVGLGDEERRKAQEYFQQAIGADPNFAPAYIGMANAHYVLFQSSTEDRAIAKASAEKAVLLDPLSSEAHNVLGMTKLADSDWLGAEESFRRAIALNPSNADGYDGLCDILLDKGRVDEGLKECQIAQALDPNNDHLLNALEARREYAGAIELLQKELQSHPEGADLHYFLFRDYDLNGMPKEAVHELEQSMILIRHPEIATNVHRAFATSGYLGAMRQFAKDFEHLHATHQIYLPRLMAEIYARLGDKDHAFYWLEQGYQNRDRIGDYGNITIIKREHELDPLRSDPRYADLLRRIGLPP